MESVSECYGSVISGCGNLAGFSGWFIVEFVSRLRGFVHVIEAGGWLEKKKGYSRRLKMVSIG